MSKHMRIALGQALRKAREDAGLTQEDIARVADTHGQQPSLWERGLRWADDVDIAAYVELTDATLEDIWIDAARRCITITITQPISAEAVRAERRSERQRRQSRRKPRAKGSRPAGA